MKKILCFAAMLAVVFGCDKDKPNNGGGTEPTPTEDKVVVTPATHTFAAGGGTFEVAVTSSADWTVSPADGAWVKPSVTKGKNGDKVKFTASVNEETTARTAVTFTFTVGKATATFVVDQEAADEPEPTVEFELDNPEQANIQLGAGTGGATVLLKTSLKASDITYKKSDGADWISQVMIMDVTAGPTIGIAVTENTGAERTATVTFSATGAKDIVITIVQAAGSSSEPGTVKAVNFEKALLHTDWPNPDKLNDLTKFTVEALVYSGEFNKGGSSEDWLINTVLGVEGKFLVRTWGQNGNAQIDISFGGSPEQNLKNGTTLPVNKWSHIAVTFDNGKVILYLNGENKGELTVTNGFEKMTFQTGTWAEEPTWGSKRNFALGCSVDYRRCWCGTMREVRIWNKVLTASDIKASGHYYSVPTNSDGLVAYWKLNEGEGNTIKDYANSNDLTGNYGISGICNSGSMSYGTAGIQWMDVPEPKVE